MPEARDLKKQVNFLPAMVVLVLCLALSALSALYVNSMMTENAQQRFDWRVEQIEQDITERMALYRQVLAGGVALVRSDPDLSRADWHRFVTMQELTRRYPGIQGIGYAKRLTPDEVSGHEAEVRADGFAEYQVTPVGDRPIMSAIMYLEPFDERNRRAFGYDMFSEPTRRTAMERAMLTGEAALSGRVTLLQEGDGPIQAGTLLYMPVYQGLPAQAEPADRRKALVGWVYAPFRMNDLMQGIVGRGLQHIGFEIYDMAQQAEQTRMYSYGLTGTEQRSDLETFRVLDIAGRPWGVRVLAKPDFLAPLDRYTAAGVFAIGVVFSLLLMFYLRVMMVRRLEAQKRTMLVERALERTEARFRILAENSGDLVTLHKQDGTYLYVSPAARTVLGRSPEDLATMSAVELVLPEDTGKIATNIVAVLAGKTVPPFRYRIMMPDGNPRWLESTCSLITSKDGEPQIVANSRDVTDRVDQENSLVAAKEALESQADELKRLRTEADAANRAKTDFLAAMSHEIRTPMNGVLGMIQLMRADGLEGEQDKRAEIVLHSAEAALTIINDILDISKLEAGKMELHAAPFKLADLIANAIEIVRPRADQKGVPIVVSNSVPTDAGFLGDGPRLRQVLINLLGNAVKFTSEGEVRLNVRHYSDDRGDRLAFEVSDTGIGIPADRVDLLFHKFAQADNSIARRFGGTGLGLALCEEFVRLMQGSIEVESEEGVGSTFRFDVAMDRTMTLVPDQKQDKGGARARNIQGRILVVDDSDTNRLLASTVLLRAGHKVETCNDGSAAVDLLKGDHGFDLVLMDIQMPVLDGISATRQIRQHEVENNQARVPIIALTANAMVGQKEAYLKEGMDDYLSKPFDIDVMTGMISDCLAGRSGKTEESAAVDVEADADLDRIDADYWMTMVDMLGSVEALSLLQGAQRDVEMRLNRLSDLTVPNDLYSIERETHDLVATAGNVGLVGLSEEARALSSACRAQDEEAVAAQLQRLAGAEIAVWAEMTRLANQSRVRARG